MAALAVSMWKTHVADEVIKDVVKYDKKSGKLLIGYEGAKKKGGLTGLHAGMMQGAVDKFRNWGQADMMKWGPLSQFMGEGIMIGKQFNKLMPAVMELNKAYEKGMKVAAAQKEAAMKLDSTFAHGTKRFEKLIDRLEGAYDYEFPVAKWGQLHRQTTALRRVMPKLPSAARDKVSFALSRVKRMEELQTMSESGKVLTPGQRAEQTKIAGQVLLVSRMAQAYGALTKKSVDKYRKQFFKPVAEASSKENLEASRALAAMGPETGLPVEGPEGFHSTSWWKPEKAWGGMGYQVYANEQERRQYATTPKSVEGGPSHEQLMRISAALVASERATADLKKIMKGTINVNVVSHAGAKDPMEGSDKGGNDTL
jgi:hypothetical protein